MRTTIMAAVLAAAAFLTSPTPSEARPYEDPPPHAPRGSIPDENGFAYRYRGGNPNRDRAALGRPAPAERVVSVAPNAARWKQSHRRGTAYRQTQQGYGRAPYIAGEGRVFGAYGRPYWRNVAYAPAPSTYGYRRSNAFDCR